MRIGSCIPLPPLGVGFYYFLKWLRGAYTSFLCPWVGSTDDDLELRRQREWVIAEDTYGLYRPGLNEDVVYVHRQTTERFAVAPDSWDPIPVGHDVLPAEILEDIARWYNDIQDQWRELTWWLCRVHRSSTLSAQPILGFTNYVLVLENDYVNSGSRPHGLIELVFGDDSFVFPTCLPEWLNWPLLQAFLEPISHRDHFGIGMLGFINGDRLCQHLVQCCNGFFVQVHYISTPFLLSELYQGAPLQANTLHAVEVDPDAGRVRWSLVYIAGGYTLIVSRHYETVDAHSKFELMVGLRRRFPDLASENFDLVKVHPSMQAMDPVVNLAKQRYVVVPVEEDLHIYVVLKLDLHPYHEVGAIIVPPVLHKE